MAKQILVIAEVRDGALKPITKEALTAALSVASDPKDVKAVLLGEGLDKLAQELCAFAPGGVLYLENPGLKSYTPETYVSALKQVVQDGSVDLLFTGHSYQAIDFFPRLAATLDAAFIPDCTGIESDDNGLIFNRKVFNGKLDARCRVQSEGIVLASLQQGAFPPGDAPGGGSVEKRDVDLTGVEARKILSIEAGGTGEVDLSEADIIVSGGRGVGDKDKFQVVFQLAEALGAAVGASRPPCDSAWVESFRQIGSSGQVVAPKLYIALGISGAIQHLVGMRGSQCIVAVNKDPNAAIFQEASYGLVGDLHEIVPALIEAVNEAREA
jgi:electron transfer flavoprotein alpha subunit